MKPKDPAKMTKPELLRLVKSLQKRIATLERIANRNEEAVGPSMLLWQDVLERTKAYS